MMMIRMPKTTGCPTSIAACRIKGGLAGRGVAVFGDGDTRFPRPPRNHPTIMPIAMTSPPSDIKFAVNPTRSMTIKVASGVRIKGPGDDQGAADVAERGTGPQPPARRLQQGPCTVFKAEVINSMRS